jgi:hypothetical protein
MRLSDSWREKMLRFTRYSVVALVLTLLAGPATASDLMLEIRDGRVTLIARDVSILQILNEWAKVGSTRIVDAERVGGPPVTLEFGGLSEREALDVILRSAAGYVAVPRQAGDPGASVFDRILVLAASNLSPASPGAASIPVPVAPKASDPRRSETLPVPPELAPPSETPPVPQEFAPPSETPPVPAEFAHPSETMTVPPEFGRPSDTLPLPPEFDGEERHEAPMPGQEPGAVPPPGAVRPFPRAPGAMQPGSSVPGVVSPPAQKPGRP